MQNKSFVVLSGIAISALVLSTHGESQAAPVSNQPPTRPTSTALPGPALNLPPAVGGLTFLGGSATKVNVQLKGFALEVPLRLSSASNPHSGVLHVKSGGVAVLNAPFSLASGETKAIPLVDSIGLPNACTPAHYDIELEGSGFDVKKKGTVTASCTFTNKSANPWNLAVPDRVEERKAKHVYFDDATATFYQHLGGSPQVPAKMADACGSKLVFKTTVVNNLTHAVSGLRLTISLGGVVKATALPFSLAAGKSSEETAQVVFVGEPGDYVLGLIDPTNSAQGAISSSGYNTAVAHTCGLTAALDP